MNVTRETKRIVTIELTEDQARVLLDLLNCLPYDLSDLKEVIEDKQEMCKLQYDEEYGDLGYKEIVTISADSLAGKLADLF